MKPAYILLFLSLQIVVFPAFGQKPNKKVTISGFVLDANQKAVQDAIICIDNQKTKVITDNKGFYKIKVSPEARSIAAFTLMNGIYETEIAGRTIINFSMNAIPSAGPVVMEKTSARETTDTGKVTVKKKKIPDLRKEEINDKYFYYLNIYDLLRGELPGIQVSGKSIMIRGPSSITLSSEPLLIVNGVIVKSIEDISPRMVKSVEVLKGAAASIYGSQGASGVIIITLIGGPDKQK